jgi:hypothetical protein
MSLLLISLTSSPFLYTRIISRWYLPWLCGLYTTDYSIVTLVTIPTLIFVLLYLTLSWSRGSYRFFYYSATCIFIKTGYPHKNCVKHTLKIPPRPSYLLQFFNSVRGASPPPNCFRIHTIICLKGIFAHLPVSIQEAGNARF